MNTRKWIDDEQMNSLNEIGGSELIGKMIDLFLENASKRMEDARRCEEKQDWKGVSSAAHALKSSLGNFGAHSAVEICTQIEAAVREDQIGKISAYLPRLEGFLTCIMEELKHVKEGLHE